MKNPADVIVALSEIDSRLAKEDIVKQAWDLNIREFFLGAQMAYDSLISYGVKKIPLIEEDDGSVPTFTWQDFVQLAHKLKTRQLTGHAARDAMIAAANACDMHSWNNFYRRVLLKDFKCGATDSTINKVLENIVAQAKKDKGTTDANNYLIPVFECQLAKNGEDHPKKMVGDKLLDYKLDGCRLLTVVDVETQEVTQYTRNGKINDRFSDIKTKLQSMLPMFKTSMVLDGEVISKNFQTLMTQVNRKENVDTSDAKLALFDIIPLGDFRNGVCNIKLLDRHELLMTLIPGFETHTQGLVYVLPKLMVNLSTPEGQNTFKEFNREALDSGVEGIMIKDPKAPYECKRTFGWLKIKPFITVDLKIVGIEPGTPESRFAHTLGNLVCEGTDQGKFIRVSVGSGFTEELRDEIWNNQDKVLGRLAEVKGDALTLSRNTADEYSIRFPTFMQFRDLEVGGSKV